MQFFLANLYSERLAGLPATTDLLHEDAEAPAEERAHAIRTERPELVDSLAR